MLDLLNVLNESINDKGIFKVVFMAGSPGAGKSYTLRQINDGAINPRVVNTDKFIEHLVDKQGLNIGDVNDQVKVLDHAKQLTQQQFTHYLDGMLPLFIDSTSSDVESTTRRMKMLTNLGYDVAMVWVESDISKSLGRIAKRDRKVNFNFIKRVEDNSNRNKAFFKSKLGDKFIEIRNNEDDISDETIRQAYKKSYRFFTGSVENPVGQRLIRRMVDDGAKYLSPRYVSEHTLKRITNGWYNKKGKKRKLT